VDAHSQNAAVTVLLSFSPIKAANMSLMHNGKPDQHSIAILTRPKIIDAWLTLILGGSGIVTNHITNKGCQYFDYGLMLLHSHWIMQDARP